MESIATAPASSVRFESLVETLFPDATGALRLVGGSAREGEGDAGVYFKRIGGAWVGLVSRRRGERPETFETALATWGGRDARFNLVLREAPAGGALLPPRHVWTRLRFALAAPRPIDPRPRVIPESVHAAREPLRALPPWRRRS